MQDSEIMYKMQDQHSQDMTKAPSMSWSYSHSDLLRYQAQAFQHFGDNEEVMAAVHQQALPTVTDSSGVYQLWRNVVADSLATENDEGELRTKVADLWVALRASERARNEGQNETDALRRYLAEVEVAAAGLVSRIQELEHLLTLTTASQEHWDMEQLRGQMLTISARDARQQAVAASEAISTARMATMDLDKVKREASAITMSQEEEIRILRAEASHYLTLFEGIEAQLQQMKRDKEKLVNSAVDVQIHQCQEADVALTASHDEVMVLRQRIDGMKKGAAEKDAQIQDLVQALEFTKATACAAENGLQEAQVERKDISIQNELLQHEVADLQSREVQATIAHYDHELCKVRAVLEGEKAQLLTELARYRRGNQNLKGELAECRGKYNAVRSRSTSALELASTTYEPTAYASSKLRDFFSMNASDNTLQTGERYLSSGQTEWRAGPIVPITGCSSQLQPSESHESQVCMSKKKDRKDMLWKLEGRDQQGKVFSETIESENGQVAISETSHTEGQLGISEAREYGEGQKCLIEGSDAPYCSSGRRLSDNEVLRLDRTGKTELYLQKKKTKICRSPGNQEISPFSNVRSNEAEGMHNTAKNMHSISFHGMTPSGEDHGIALTEDNCLETGENLLAEAHKEICKLKQEKECSGLSGKVRRQWKTAICCQLEAFRPHHLLSTPCCHSSGIAKKNRPRLGDE